MHEYPFAKLAAAGQADCVLVGDSIGMTVFGFESLVEDARVLKESGICMLVLEAVPADLEGRCRPCARHAHRFEFARRSR